MSFPHLKYAYNSKVQHNKEKINAEQENRSFKWTIITDVVFLRQKWGLEDSSLHAELYVMNTY